MVHFRAEKVERIAHDIPDLKVVGEQEGELLVLGWGSTYGPALVRCPARASRGASPSHTLTCRYLNPFPRTSATCCRASTRC